MTNTYIEVIEENKSTILDMVIDVLFGGPTDKLKMLSEVLLKDGRIGDLIFWNNFIVFLKEGNFDVIKLRKLSEKLEEHGNTKSYGIAIIKAIDDVESEEKARCLANLTQSVINSQVTVENYFRLVHTLKQLIRDDFEFLSENISKAKFFSNEHLDDYLITGLIREVDGGYVYTERAWDLVEFGILRGHKIERPDKIEEREIFSLGLADYGDESESI